MPGGGDITGVLARYCISSEVNWSSFLPSIAASTMNKWRGEVKADVSFTEQQALLLSQPAP